MRLLVLFITAFIILLQQAVALSVRVPDLARAQTCETGIPGAVYICGFEHWDLENPAHNGHSAYRYLVYFLLRPLTCSRLRLLVVREGERVLARL